ncbi:MAG: hypothetical protein JSR75_16700 [Proteobacteria bacterium]|nr:hypothetical protein [Pseudomonadota bacterium]
MKRLIGTFLAIFAIAALSDAAIAQKVYKRNSTYCYEHPGAAGGCENTQAPTGRVGTVMIPNSYMRNLLPSDLVYVDRTKPTYPCDDNGAHVIGSLKFCSNAVSQGTGQRYVLMGDTTFIVHGGKLVKYAAFNGGTDSAGVAYLSPEARQYAEAHGYRYDQRSNTMVAINAPKETPQAPNDCSGKVMLEKIKCEALNNQTLRGSKHK